MLLFFFVWTVVARSVWRPPAPPSRSLTPLPFRKRILKRGNCSGLPAVSLADPGIVVLPQRCLSAARFVLVPPALPACRPQPCGGARRNP